jgi:hypothetical protein
MNLVLVCGNQLFALPGLGLCPFIPTCSHGGAARQGGIYHYMCFMSHYQDDGGQAEFPTRPSLTVPPPVAEWCRDNGIPLELLYAVRRFSVLAMLPESMQAMVTLIRFLMDNPGMIPLQPLEVSELGNLLQFTVDCNIPLEGHGYLKVLAA